MKNKYLLLFSSACTYLCFLGFIVVLKKPLCLDSTVVNKIDRVTISNSTETAYSCSLNKPVEYSASLDNLIEKITPQLDRIVLLLESIRPFQNKVEISIREDRPLMFQVNENKINIGSQFLNLDYHLSRALIKSWMSDNHSTSLLDESLSDFILYILTGKVEIEDPVDRTRTKLGSVKWPQVIKKSQGYCLSAWKYAEHIENCDLSDDRAVVYSLRPLLTSSLIGSYNELSASQKAHFIRNLPFMLNGINTSSEDLLTEANPLRQGIAHINKFTELFLNSTSHQFYSGLTNQLQQYGVTDSFTEAYFDYILEYEGQIDHKTLEAASAKNLQVQVALRDEKNIWILPSKTALPLTAFNQIQARQTVLIGCKNIRNASVDRFFKKTEKLLLINNCQPNAVYDFDMLFSRGVKAFVSSNPKLSFIQLHVPSLEMIYQELSAPQDFFKLVKNQDIHSKELKALGWRDVRWKNDLQAYRPEAIVEAIEYFRN